MKAILAIASLAVRSAIRSKLFVSLLVVLLLVLVGLPLAVKGDGTAVGRCNVLLSYTLGLSAFLLAAVTLWVSCGAIAQEIEDRQIRMVVVKPVNRMQVWVGKWLGILLIDALLLCVVGLALSLLLYGTLYSKVRSESERELVRREILVGRHRIRPRVEAVEDEARRDVERLIAADELPRDLATTAYRHIRTRRLIEQFTVAPGQSRSWIFKVPRSHTEGAEVTFRYNMSASFRDRNPVTGTWALGLVGRRSVFEAPIMDAVSGPHYLPVPSSLVVPGEELVLSFANGPQGQTSSAVFDFERGIELLAQRSRFGPNLGRALLIVFAFLAFLAALGLSMGSLVSFPVAVFLSAGLMGIMAISHAFTASVVKDNPFLRMEIPVRFEFIHKTGESIMRCVDALISPLLALNPLGALAGGLLVPWQDVGKAFWMLLVVGPAVMCLLGGWFLKRRELAR